MTCSTSDVCRLLFQCLGKVGGALAQFVEQPRVLDGDDGLGGEVLTNAICLSVKGRTSWRYMQTAPTSSFSFSIGTAEYRPHAPKFDGGDRRWIALNIGRLAPTSAHVLPLCVAIIRPSGLWRVDETVECLRALGEGRWRVVHARRGASASPPADKIFPNFASQTRTAFSSMAANTG